MYSEEINPKLF